MKIKSDNNTTIKIETSKKVNTYYTQERFFRDTHS